MQISASQYLNNSGTEKCYTGVFHYTRPVRGRYDKYVEMYGLLSVKSDVDIPGANIAKFAWDGIVDGFEYSKAESINEALKISLSEATRRIKRLIANDKNISEHGVDINFSVFVSGSFGIYVAYLGECDIYIYKEGKIIDIYEMLSKRGAKTAGLVLEDNDILFASTSTFLKRNMNEFIGLPDSSHILEKIDKIAKDLDYGEGILLFTKAINDSEAKEDESAEDMVDDTKGVVNKEKKGSKKVHNVVYPSAGVGKILNSIKKTFANATEKISVVYSKSEPIRIKIKGVFSKLSYSIKAKLGGILSKLNRKKWFKKASARISQSELNIPKKEGFKSFKVDGYRIRNRQVERFKITFFVVLGITLVVLGVRFTINESEARRVSNQANEIFKTVENFVSSAEEKQATDREAAETLVFKAENELSKVPEGLREDDLAKLSELKSRILSVQDSMYKRKGVTESDDSLEPYMSTRIKFGEGSNPSDIVIYQDNNKNEYLLVSDIGLKAVFRVSLYNEEVQRLPDTEKLLKRPGMMYVGEGGLYVMDLDVGVLKAEFDEDGWFKPFTKLTALGIENFDNADIAEFAVLTEVDNVYVLDRNRKALLKANNYESGYGTPYIYIEDDSLATSNDVFADLSTYILVSGAQGLQRYIFSNAEGKLVLSPLEIVGVDGEFKNLKYGYTRVDLNFDLYLYDSEDKRVMRFEKPMEGGGQIRHPNQVVLRNQYIYRGDRENVWENVKDLVVTSDQKTLYMLDSNTIWGISL